MADKKFKITPVPDDVLSKLRADQTAMLEAVTKSSAQVEELTERQVPRIESVASEARDGVIKLSARQSRFEDDTKRIAEDVCKENHGNCDPVKGLSRIKNRVLGALLTVVIVVIGASFAVWRSIGEQDQRIIVNASDVVETKDRLKVLEKGRQEDMRLILGQLGQIPSQVKQSVEDANPDEHPLQAIEEAIDDDDSPLTSHETKEIRRFLKRADRREKRNGGHKNKGPNGNGG